MRHIQLQLLLAAGAIATICSTHATHAQAPRPTLRDTTTCLELAEHRTDLVPDQRARLCMSTPSPHAPVDCYLEATRTLLLTDPQAIELCRCSPDVVPARCVYSLRREGQYTDPEMVTLCSPTLALGLRSDCTPIP